MFSALGILALFCCQQSAIEFDIELPSYFGEFVDNGDASFTAKSTSPLAVVKVARYELATSGVYLDAVLADIKQRQWQPLSQSYSTFKIEDWKGNLSLLNGGGFEVYFNDSVVLQRIAVHNTMMVVLSFEGPSIHLQEARDSLDSFSIPPHWMPSAAVISDMYQGNGPSGLSQDYPGILDISVSLSQISESKLIGFEINFLGNDSAPAFKWQLPSSALNSKVTTSGGIRYQLPLGDIKNPNNQNGLFRFTENDITAFDPLWLALPLFDSDVAYNSPAWRINLAYAPHLVGVSAPMATVEVNNDDHLKHSSTVVVPAGKSWPFFAIANYRPLVTNDFKWFLRLDSKSKLPQDMMTELLLLDSNLSNRLGPHLLEFTVASFPHSGDRLFSGLLIFDESQGWFDSPTDTMLNDVPRRVLLARALCEYRFGIECLGLGTAKLFLTRSLAEFLSYQLLLDADYGSEAETMLSGWLEQEKAAGPLPQALSLIDVGDLYGSRRILSYGALVWLEIHKLLGRSAFDKLITSIYTQGDYSAVDLLHRLQSVKISYDWNAFFKRHIFGNQAIVKK
ncbi:MAG: hypothetical protein H8E25_04415 [Planctomycetes bacterium]|nr:hypothetical protein [Planctomycetota bacterium]